MSASPRPVSVPALYRLLDRAATDARISGVLIRVASAPFGPGRVQEGRDLLETFRASYKPVIAFAEGPDTLGYLLATGASEVWLDSGSTLYVTGLQLTAFFLKDVLGRFRESNTQTWLLSVGLTVSLGRDADADGDGVGDTADECPNTPQGAIVNARGCPSDSDGDGVPEGIDECPETPPGVPVDERGCPRPR